MSHWPDLERCRKLKEKGFPQEESHFVWALTEIRSEDPKHRHNEWIRITRSQAIVEEIEGYPYYRLIAAPIVTELIGEIRKLIPSHVAPDCPTMEFFYMPGPMDQGESWRAGCYYQFELDEDADYCAADTPPNALADLWLWLQEKGENHER